MNKKHLAFALGALLVAGANSSVVVAGQAHIDEIENAAAVLDILKLLELTNETQGYDLALAEYRLAISFNIQGSHSDAKAAIDRSINTLLKVNEDQPHDVEVKALLAQTYGYKISLQPLKGAVYGSKLKTVLDEAENLDPTNPRVLLVKGIAAINTPPLFGGSKDRALDSFTQSISQFGVGKFMDVDWGYAEAYAWRGLVYSQLGEQEKAVADWYAALEVNPNYGWAKALLSEIAH